MFSVAQAHSFIQRFFKRQPAFWELVLALGAALLLLHQQATLPAWWPWFLAMAAFALLASRWRLFLLPCCFVAGMAWGIWQAQSIAQQHLAPALVGPRVQVQGVIVSLPAYQDERARFVLKVERIIAPVGLPPFKGRVQVSYKKAPADLHYGQRWEFGLLLQPLRVPPNPGSHDASFNLFWRDIQATARVDGPAGRLLAEGVANPVMQHINDWRLKIIAASNAALPKPEAGLIQALSVGVPDQIPADGWDIFVRTGTAHLMVISGSHITLVAGLVFGLARFLWILIPPLARRVPAAQFASLMMLSSAWFYGLMAGLDLATFRAVIMVSTLALMLLLQREFRLGHALAMAAALIFLVEPGAVMERGFWLSFGAVALIFWLLAGGLAGGRPWRRFLNYQLLITLGMLPLLALFFGQISLIGPLANMVAIPLIEFLATPLALLGALASMLDAHVPGRLFFYAASAVLEGVLHMLRWLDRLPDASISVLQPDGWRMLALGLGLLLLLLPRAWPGRAWGMLGLLALFLPSPNVPSPGRVWLDVLDAERNGAWVLRTRHHALLFETGAFPGSLAGFNRYAAAPFLHYAGISHLDAQIIHMDGGRGPASGDILSRPLRPDRLWADSDTGGPGRASFAQGESCEAGRSWVWDDVTFVFIHPLPEDGAWSPCVLAVYGGGWQILLAPDINDRLAARLVQRFGYNLRSQVLILPQRAALMRLEDFFRQTAPARIFIATRDRAAPAGLRLPIQGRALEDSGPMHFELGGAQTWLEAPLPGPPRRYWRS